MRKPGSCDTRRVCGHQGVNRRSPSSHDHRLALLSTAPPSMLVTSRSDHPATSLQPRSRHVTRVHTHKQQASKHTHTPAHNTPHLWRAAPARRRPGAAPSRVSPLSGPAGRMRPPPGAYAYTWTHRELCGGDLADRRAARWRAMHAPDADAGTWQALMQTLCRAHTVWRHPCTPPHAHSTHLPLQLLHIGLLGLEPPLRLWCKHQQ
jgi:hypothetical protein